MRFTGSLTASRYTWLLLLLGCFAVALHTWAGMQLMGMQPARTNGQGNFVAELCTVLSVGNAQATPTQTVDSSDAPASTNNAHDCCTLCAASSPILLTQSSLAASPAPTFLASLSVFISARPASLAWTAHPPRGPPVLV